MKVLLVIIVAYLLHALIATYASSPPRYIIDLDQPPEERWARVAEDYSEFWNRSLAEIEKTLPKELMSTVSTLTDHLDDYFPYPYADEFRGIVKYAGNNVTIEQAIMANLYYELMVYRHDNDNTEEQHGACTSIVASDENGRLIIGHNLDYYPFLSVLLRNITIEVQFKNKHNSNIFTGTTIAGFVGVLTGAKPGGLSISLDQKKQKNEWWENAISALKEGSHIAGLLTRDILQTEGMDFKSAVQRLSAAPLISPCYIIVGGLIDTQGVVITRDRTAVVDKWFIDPPNKWYLIETNFDHWKAAGDNRREAGVEAMNSVGRAGINIDSLFTVLSTPPILGQNETVCTTIMVPREGSEFYYNTTLRYA